MLDSRRVSPPQHLLLSVLSKNTSQIQIFWHHFERGAML